MRSGNPVLKNTPFAQPGAEDTYASSISGANLNAMDNAAQKADVMTIRGTAMKTIYMVLIAVVTAAASWNYFSDHPGAIMMACIGSLIGSLITGFVIYRSPKIAHFVVPLFAFAQGMFLAAFSVAIIEYSSLGQRLVPAGTTDPDVIRAAGFEVVGQAAGLTFAIAGAVLLGYATGLLRLGSMAKKMIIVMTAGVMLYYLIAFIGNMALGGGTIPNLGMSASPIGIGFSLLVVVLASFNLLLDFQTIDEGAKRGMPKHYEWVGAFAILTTLVWLYIELLRLLMKLRSSD